MFIFSQINIIYNIFISSLIYFQDRITQRKKALKGLLNGGLKCMLSYAGSKQKDLLDKNWIYCAILNLFKKFIDRL